MRSFWVDLLGHQRLGYRYGLRGETDHFPAALGVVRRRRLFIDGSCVSQWTVAVNSGQRCATWNLFRKRGVRLRGFVGGGSYSAYPIKADVVQIYVSWLEG